MPVVKGHHLFKFKGFENSDIPRGGVFGNKDGALFDQEHGAPDARPINSLGQFGFNFQTPKIDDVSAIDVVNDFEWTHTPGHGRHEVPFMRLSEYRVNFNSLLQNIRYLLQGFTNGEIMDNSFVKSLGVKGKSTKFKNQIHKWLDTASTQIDNVRNGLTKRLGLGTMTTPESVAKYLTPYYGLYGASPTGFEYYLPFFEDNWKTVDSKWANFTEGGGALAGVYGELFSREGLLRTLTSTTLLSPNALGAYIERPKQYGYGDDTPSIRVSFDLINTQRQTDVIKNWQLIFLLLYQNLPNRTSKVLVEPPVIYEVEVPGTFYSPYAYISSIKITNQGATRLMNLPYKMEQSLKTMIGIHESAFYSQAGIGADSPSRHKNSERYDGFSDDTGAKRVTEVFKHGNFGGVPGLVDSLQTPAGTDIKYVKTLIPDAFKVDITLTSLIPESKNLFFHSILGKNTLNTGIYSGSFFDDSLRGGKDDKASGGALFEDRTIPDKEEETVKTLDGRVVKVQTGTIVNGQAYDNKGNPVAPENSNLSPYDRHIQIPNQQ